MAWVRKLLTKLRILKLLKKIFPFSMHGKFWNKIYRKNTISELRFWKAIIVPWLCHQLNQMTLTGNLIPKNQNFKFEKNKSIDFFKCHFHDEFKTTVFWSLNEMNALECKTYSCSFWCAQDKNFPRIYMDDQVQLLDLWKSFKIQYGLKFESALQLQYPSNLNVLFN